MRRTKYSEKAIKAAYQKNLSVACRMLASLPFAGGRPPNVRGLNGWVFEQTIRHYLAEEMKCLRLSPDIEEQVCILGRAKVDLRVGRVAIEMKAAGSFGDGSNPYA